MASELSHHCPLNLEMAHQTCHPKTECRAFCQPVPRTPYSQCSRAPSSDKLFGQCGLGLNFPTFCFLLSDCQKQREGGNLKDAIFVFLPVHQDSVGGQEALGQTFPLLLQAGKGTGGSILLPVKADWF